MNKHNTHNGNHQASGQEQAWGGLLTDLTPERERAKPRRRGVTMILDRCQGLADTADLLEMVGPYVDQIKLRFGTSVLPRCRRLKAPAA